MIGALLSSSTKEFELNESESVIRETRKHWFLFVLELLPFVILAILPILLPLLPGISPQMSLYAERLNYGEPLMRAAIGVWLIAVWTVAWGTFTRYFLNAWVLTNERIVTIK